MEEKHVPEQMGPHYDPSSARGTEAGREYQYGKGDHGAKAEDAAPAQGGKSE